MTMNKPLRRSPFRLTLAMALVAAAAAASVAAEEAPTVQDVEEARRCAAATRTAGHAFSEVRDSVRAGGTTRAQALLTEAEDALGDARAACGGNAEVSEQLDLLSGEARDLRRTLGAAPR